MLDLVAKGMGRNLADCTFVIVVDDMQHASEPRDLLGLLADLGLSSEALVVVVIAVDNWRVFEGSFWWSTRPLVRLTMKRLTEPPKLCGEAVFKTEGVIGRMVGDCEGHCGALAVLERLTKEINLETIQEGEAYKIFTAALREAYPLAFESEHLRPTLHAILLGHYHDGTQYLPGTTKYPSDVASNGLVEWDYYNNHLSAPYIYLLAAAELTGDVDLLNRRRSDAIKSQEFTRG